MLRLYHEYVWVFTTLVVWENNIAKLVPQTLYSFDDFKLSPKVKSESSLGIHTRTSKTTN